MRPVTQLALAMILAALAGCDTFYPDQGDSAILLSISLPERERVEGDQALSKALTITLVTVTVTGADMDRVTENLDVSGSTASGTVLVPKGTDRTFSVECFDGNGNIQYSGETTIDIEEATAEVSITTEGHFPSGSTLLLDGYNSSNVELSWTRNSDTDFAAYELVRASTASQLASSSTRTRLAYYSTRATLSYTDTTVEQNSVYFYAVVVWDSEGLGLRSSPKGVITPRYLSSNIAPVTIPDLGSNGIYFLDNSFAPNDAIVTGVDYTIRVGDDNNPNAFWTSDYRIYISSNSAQLAIVDVLVWNNEGGQTDSGDDDDLANDSDIFLFWRSTSLFNGESPNQYWGVYVEDVVAGDSGVLDFIQLEIYYSSASLLKQATPVTGKTTLAFNRGAGWSISSHSEDNRPVATASGAAELGQTRLPTGSGRARAKQ